MLKKIALFIMFFSAFQAVLGSGSDFIDFNKNGRMDIYENPSAPISERVADLLGQMTLEEKTCQLASLYGFGFCLKDKIPTPEWKCEIWKDGVANIDEHLNGYRKGCEEYLGFREHARAVNLIQKWFIENTRLGIPAEFSGEAMLGLAHRNASSMPAPISLGSSWDVDLVEKIGKTVGRQGRLIGYNSVNMPILDVSRDPRWGRTNECFSEDPFLTAKLGMAITNGLRSQNMGSTLKHFAVHSVPDGARDGLARVNPHAAWNEVREIHLYPFEQVVKNCDPTSVMTTYNDYAGIPLSSNKLFLTDILRKEYGFEGYVISDSGAVEDLAAKHEVAKNLEEAVALSINAGLNVRINFSSSEEFIKALRKCVADGLVSEETLNDRVSDVLRVKMKLGLFDNPFVSEEKAADAIRTEDCSLELEAARKCLVLLKNEKSTLPLDPKKIKKILVCGPMANDSSFEKNRYGPSGIKMETLLEALKKYSEGKFELSYSKGCEVFDEDYPKSEYMRLPIRKNDELSISEAAESASDCDVIIAALGECESIVGESRTRISLDLPGRQEELLEALTKTGKPVIVVLFNGRPLSINAADEKASAILEAWIPNRRSATAITEAIFGKYNPGGKIANTFPRSVGQIQLNFPYRKSSHSGASDKNKKFCVNTPLYHFGFGLSYTKFKYSNLKVSKRGSGGEFEVAVKVDVENSGNFDGDEIVQLYVRDCLSSVATFEKVLRGFKRTPIKRGEKKTVDFRLKPDDFKLWKNGKWVLEPGEFKIEVGSSSEDIRLSESIFLP